MHETPKGADPSMQDRDQQGGMDRQQNQQNRDQGNAQQGGGGSAGEGASGMQDRDASGAGYGNNAGTQGSEGERGR